MFMAQTGSFSVPLKCTAKRCVVSDFLEYVQSQYHNSSRKCEMHEHY